MPLNIREFFKYGGIIENYERKVCLTTEKMAKAQPSSSKLFKKTYFIKLFSNWKLNIQI